MPGEGLALNRAPREVSYQMMPAANFRLIGSGVYSLPEAERLTHIPRKRIRRWMEGYQFVSSGKRHYSPPVIDPAIGRDVGELALTFQDLVEVRFLEAFLRKGVKWKEMRLAAVRAKELLNKTHPFSSRIFKTDGRYILAEIAGGHSVALLNLSRNQMEFHAVVSPMLHGLEFNEFDEAERWFPMSKRKSVVIDPARSFGAPIVIEGGVPTRILAASARAERSQRVTSRIYDVPLRAVRNAVYYETKFLA
jgi:uncharacterized protein (DUF433 family)